jgi:glutamine cyclotransferase
MCRPTAEQELLLKATLLGLTLMAAVLLCSLPSPVFGGEAPVSGYRVVNSFPHDRKAFTQGLAPGFMASPACAGLT